ncbi:hypothetical protein ARMGADRAFT_1080361 [Armillaria gallica]|uniref:Uncharacterized protein n=1 Tax=Armillaria gallica TaxID=47427 RepID=A0A2H3DQS3_ARMGA|nr:hypothetical protein ARMGADRAFT_1080361 [Armillaria gallica]
MSSDTLPLIPKADAGFRDPQVLWPAEPDYFIGRRWASNAMPYQGFLPVNRESIYQCELFKPLNYTVQTIPIFSPTSGTWMVENTIVEKWKDLEALLQCCKTVLEERFVTHKNIDYVSFPLPWRYGYHRSKRSRQAMARASMRSRDAFIIMAAEISYLLALTSGSPTNIDAENQFHSWSAELTKRVGGNWVDLIRSSWMVQRDVGFWEGDECQALRVGLFIDARTCNFTHFLHAYHWWNVPLWIDWGPLEAPYKARDVRLSSHYCIRLPPHRIQTRVSHPPPSEMQTCAPETGVQEDNSIDGKPVEVMTMSDSNSTTSTDIDSTGRVVCPVTVSSDSNVELVDDHEEGEICEPSEGPAPAVKDRTVKEWEMVHGRMYGTHKNDLIPKPLSVCTLDETLRFRFGVILVPSLSPSPAQPSITSEERRKFSELRKNAGCSILPSDPMLEAPMMLQIFDGLQWLISLAREGGGNAISPSQMPVQCWDLNQKASHYLSRRTKPDFMVSVVRWRQEDRCGYEMVPAAGESRSYRLIVYRATDVLHCLRLREAVCLDDFVEELCRYGVRFSTCVEGNMVRLRQKRFQDAIPYRPVGFQPDLSDYAYYVRKRRALLEDPAVARAALMHGGLIWRIAMEHIPDPDFILSGSGQDTSRYRVCHRIQGVGKPDFDIWEETLSEDQIDLLCGVYRVYRSAEGSPKFTQDLSWFPRRCSFRNSGLDLGHWSPDAENWYQRRIQMYLTGDPKGCCLNQSEWKNAIRLWRNTSRTFKGIEIVSRAFVHRHLLQHAE